MSLFESHPEICRMCSLSLHFELSSFTKGAYHLAYWCVLEPHPTELSICMNSWVLHRAPPSLLCCPFRIHKETSLPTSSGHMRPVLFHLLHSNCSSCSLCPFLPGMPVRMSTLSKASTNPASPALCCLLADSIIPLWDPMYQVPFLWRSQPVSHIIFFPYLSSISLFYYH